MENAEYITSTNPHTMPPVAVVTDSVAQVPAETAKQWGITVVPFQVSIEGEVYRDGIDLDLSELYRRMRTKKVLPTTIAPSPEQFKEIFQRLLDQGAEAILHVSLASKLSSSYNNACLAAKEVLANNLHKTIEVFDSRLAAIAQGFVAIAAAWAASEGKKIEEVLQAAREAARRSGLVATVETLEYLARGGRIGRAAYLIGSMIQITPLLTIGADGVVEPVAKLRGKKRSLQAIVDYVGRQMDECRKVQMAILEADAKEAAAELRELVRQKLNIEELLITEFTPVMGAHTGPGLIGLAYTCE